MCVFFFFQKKRHFDAAPFVFLLVTRGHSHLHNSPECANIEAKAQEWEGEGTGEGDGH